MMFRRIVCVLLVLLLLTAICPIGINGAEDFYDQAELLLIKSHMEKDAGMSKYATVQGACTDGKYAYFAVQEYSTVILKYDMSNWKLKKKATVSDLGHANDMTYNAKENVIVVANNNTVKDMLTLVDPDTLETKGTVEVKRDKTAKEKQDKTDTKDYKVLNVYSVAYQEKEDRYVVGLSGTYNFAVLDAKFKQIKQYKGVDTGNTRQGCDCDDDYIYFTRSGGDNIVVIYDYSGKYIDTVTINHSQEVENLFHVGKDFYLTLHYYGNSLERVGFSKTTQISFKVNYQPGSGKGKMEPTTVHYGEETKLRKCSFTKEGYFFGGWQVSRSCDGKSIGTRIDSDQRAWLTQKELYNYRLYDDEAEVAKLTKVGEATLTAFWISERYTIRYDCGSGEGLMEDETAEYTGEHPLAQNRFVRHGYIFGGYTAQRDADGRVYGYREGEVHPRWLDPGDAQSLYLFDEGEEVSRLTYDGAVTFTAQFTSAFHFDDTQQTLLSYIGVDERVDVPDPAGVLNTIASGAFRDNMIMTELWVPQTVEVMEYGAVADCSALERVFFEEDFPDSFDDDCITGSHHPQIYLVIDGQPILVGFFSDRKCAVLIRRCAEVIGQGFVLS